MSLHTVSHFRALKPWVGIPIFPGKKAGSIADVLGRLDVLKQIAAAGDEATPQALRQVWMIFHRY